MSYSYSSSSYSYSSSSTRDGETVRHGQRQEQQAVRDPQTGEVTLQTTSQNLGEPVVQETRRFDNQGRELVGDTGAARLGGGASEAPRITDVTEKEAATEAERQKEVDRQYRERMEEEYAKREGGA